MIKRTSGICTFSFWVSVTITGFMVIKLIAWLGGMWLGEVSGVLARGILGFQLIEATAPLSLN